MHETGLDFLKNKYNLHNSPEVHQAAARFHARTGERVKGDPASRIQNYLDRFREISDREDPVERERGLDALKRLLYQTQVIKPGDIPQSYFDSQIRILRERGQGGDWDTLSEREQKRILNQGIDAVIVDQERSLDIWIDYFSSADAPHPDWLKYYAMRSVLTIQSYDKENKVFPQRSKGTVNPFPELNREALAYVLDALEKKYTGQHIDLAAFEEKDQVQLKKLLSGENFGKLYAWAIEKVTPTSVDQLAITAGGWTVFPRGVDPMTYEPTIIVGEKTYKGKPLVPSLQGHGTGWCTAGESTARTQLAGGDFHVYYSLDREGKPIIPRIAIRMEGDHIGEVRGIAPEQNIDPHIGPFVDEKLKKFPDGKTYEKKVHDMKILTSIGKKISAGLPLHKEDLRFLYEMDGPIQGFGYKKDPRIQELHRQRDPLQDARIVLAPEGRSILAPDEIAGSEEEICSRTQAFVGPLFPGIFTQLPFDVPIYASFPERPIRRKEVVIGGETVQQLEQKFLRSTFNISTHAQHMMENSTFTTLDHKETIPLVQLSVADLGFPQKANTKEIYARARFLGLDLCPAEVGPYLRLQDTDQPMDDWYLIAMEQIADRGNFSCIFSLVSRRGDFWLEDRWACHDYRWVAGSRFVFTL